MAEKTLTFNQSLQKINVLFKYSGMNLEKNIKTTSEMLKHRWFFTFNLLWVLVALCASLYYISLVITQGMDFMELPKLASCHTFTILAIAKALFHLFSEDKVSNLLEILRKLEREDRLRDTSQEKDKIAAEEINFLSRVVNVLYFLNVTMLIGFNMMPMVLIAVEYHKTKEFVMLLPFMDMFAYLPNEFKYWPFAYILQVWAVCVSLLLMGASDCLFFTYCTYIRIQFIMLQHDIEGLIPGESEQITNEEFHAEFKKIVQWHQRIIECCNMLETIYSKANLGNFLCSSLIICLTGFTVTIVEDFANTLTFVTFLLMGLTQVFLICFFADLVMTASMDVSHAVYKSRWYMTSVKNNKGLLLMLTRSQTPCRITAFGFADVNLNAFTRVLSTSWSYFALLQTMYGESH